MASHPKATDLPVLLAKLCDLDIVHRRTPENIERLLELLLQLDATMRYDFANRGLRPTAELLAGRGHLNLSTSLGPIDPLCELDGLGFDELLVHSQSMVDEGRLLRVLDLPTLITVKTKAGRPKDRLLPIAFPERSCDDVQAR